MSPVHEAPSSWRRELLVWALVVVAMLAIVTLVWGTGRALALAIIAILGGSAISWFVKTRRWRRRLRDAADAEDQLRKP